MIDRKKKIMELLSRDFDYKEEELLKWEWIEVEADERYKDNLFFDGNYVLFAEDKIIWY